MVVSYCVCAQRLSQETAGQSRVGVGSSTSHEKDTILKGRTLSGARDGLFVWRLVYRQSAVSLYTLYAAAAAATTAGLSEFCRKQRRAPRQAAVRANHKRSRVLGRRSERCEAVRSVIASRGAARVRGRQGVDRLLVCFRAKRKTTFGAITSETNLQKVLWSLVSSSPCRRSPSVLHPVGEASSLRCA